MRNKFKISDEMDEKTVHIQHLFMKPFIFEEERQMGSTRRENEGIQKIKRNQTK